ncbi:MFS transporter [Actinokineospora enzanensis]|uniref:MFS transporter n=1 Tax=Actinokineospora enzanensis TaxID=155975 RepID=UPI00037E2C63|nr:MFS transporter [Actinokineospora enzanensis]
MTEQSRLTPATFVLAVVTIACGAANYAVPGLLPALSDHLHLTIPVIGQSTTLFGIASGVASPVIGVTTAHWPRRRVLSTGLALTMAGNLLAAAAPSFAALLAARLITALGSASAMTAALGQAAEINTASRRARAMAVPIAGLTLALVAAPPTAGLFAQRHGPTVVFLALATLSGAALLAARITLPGESPPSPQSSLRERLRVATHPQVPATLTAKFAAATAAFAFHTYGPTQTAHPAMLFTAYGIGAVIGNQAGGRAADRYTPRLTATAATTVQLVTFAAWPWLSSNTVAATAAAFLAGAAFWSIQPALARRLADLAPHQPTPALALDTSVVYLGMGCGGAVGALTTVSAGQGGFSGALIVLSAVSLTCLVFSGRNVIRSRVSESFSPEKTDRTSPMGRPALGRDASIEALVTPELKTRFRHLCAVRKRSMSDMVNDLIERELSGCEQQLELEVTPATDHDEAPEDLRAAS